MKQFVVKLSKELFDTKIEIERELQTGNKSNEELYSLILKIIDFLKAKRKGEPIQKNFQSIDIFINNME